MVIFLNIEEKFIEVFMDNLLVFGESFDLYLANLEKVLQCCIETNLGLN